MTTQTGSRHSWGADEHLFVEVAEDMSLEAYFRSMAIVTALGERRPDGVIDICPANASYQVRFDPDVISPGELEELVREVEGGIGDAHDFELQTRIVEIPVLYNDPWTHETLMRFRDRHQDPDVDRPRVRRADQRLRQCRGIHPGAFGGAVDGVDGRVRGRAAVPVPDGPARAPARGAQIRAAAHRHPAADRRPRRLLRVHLLGSRSRRLSDVRDHPDADLRPGPGPAGFLRTSCASSGRGTSSSSKRSTATPTTSSMPALSGGRPGSANARSPSISRSSCVDSDAYNARLLEELHAD